MRDITEQDIEFLKQLQYEMNTQDTVSQADPRFWIVRGTEKEYGYDLSECDDIELYDTDLCEIVASGMNDIIRYLKEETDITDDYDIEFEDNFGFELTLTSKYGSKYDEYMTTIYDFSEFIKRSFDYLYVIGYRNIEKNYEDTFFLAKRECDEHIKRNYYHYSDNAHSYAMTAWRSPQVEKLYDILHNVDFDNLLK